MEENEGLGWRAPVLSTKHVYLTRLALLEQVGHLDGGVAAAAWSPDGAALLLLTASGRLLLMNQVTGAQLLLSGWRIPAVRRVQCIACSMRAGQPPIADKWQNCECGAA